MFEDTTPLVEGLSIDEAFLDVRGLRRLSGTPSEIAVAAAARRCASSVGLPITVGVARTKFLAKVASGVAKPDGLLVVPPGASSSFSIRSRSSGSGVSGRSPPTKLRDSGITTVGQVAQLGEGVLVTILGRASGRHLYALAHNRDPAAGAGAPLAVARSVRSARSAAAAASLDEVDAILRRASSIASRGGCVQLDRIGRTVVLRLRFDDFSRATRSFTMTRATAETQVIAARHEDCSRLRSR